jgi:hypothetical protein
MARPTPETTTLVFAVTFAVALGVACGVWVNAKLTAAASKNLQAPARLAPAEQTTPDGVSPSVGADSQRQAADGDSHQPASENGGETPTNGPDAPSESQAESQTQSPSTATDAGHKDRPAAAVISATREARTPAEREASPSEKAPAARGDDVGAAEAEPKAVRRPVRAAPCSFYTSADSLTLRVGGAASLVVGGRGEATSVTVSTPAWADIAVFSEGSAGNGWVRYSVRSVGKRPGVYTVHFNSPCGTQSVPVMVVRP